MKKYIYALLAVFGVNFLAWSAGYNYDERGFNLFMITYLSIGLGGLAYMVGLFNE